MQTIQLSNIYLDWIGYTGPIIAMMSNIYALWIQPPYLIGYLVFLFINSIINNTIKNISREPRPINGVEIESVNIFNLGGIKDVYGMPSGHAQSVAFSLAYLYFVQEKLYIALFHSCILGLTIFQRWNYRKHTLTQLGVGVLVGLGFAFFAYHTMKHYLEDAERTTIL